MAGKRFKEPEPKAKKIKVKKDKDKNPSSKKDVKKQINTKEKNINKGQNINSKSKKVNKNNQKTINVIDNKPKKVNTNVNNGKKPTSQKRTSKKDIQKIEKEKQKKEEENEVKIQKAIEKEKKQKIKEREKRIRERNKEKEKQKEQEQFEYDSDTVIQMAQKNKDTYKAKQKKKSKSPIVDFFIILVIVAGIILAATSPIFNIKNIKVINNSQVSSDTVISLSGLTVGENIFKFLKSNVKDNIKQDAYIENVEIKRILPDTIELEVEERIKKFSVEFLNSYAIINNQGYILEISPNNQSLPILKGMSTNEADFYAGNRLNSDDLEKLEIAIKIINVCKDNNLDSKITYIDMSDNNDYKIYMESENKTIYIGDKNNLSNKMIYVQAIINQNAGMAGDVFVNGDLNNKFKPYFREKI